MILFSFLSPRDLNRTSVREIEIEIDRFTDSKTLDDRARSTTEAKINKYLTESFLEKKNDFRGTYFLFWFNIVPSN